MKKLSHAHWETGVTAVGACKRGQQAKGWSNYLTPPTSHKADHCSHCYPIILWDDAQQCRATTWLCQVAMPYFHCPETGQPQQEFASIFPDSSQKFERYRKYVGTTNIVVMYGPVWVYNFVFWSCCIFKVNPWYPEKHLMFEWFSSYIPMYGRRWTLRVQDSNSQFIPILCWLLYTAVSWICPLCRWNLKILAVQNYPHQIISYP